MRDARRIQPPIEPTQADGNRPRKMRRKLWKSRYARQTVAIALQRMLRIIRSMRHTSFPCWRRTTWRPSRLPPSISSVPPFSFPYPPLQTSALYNTMALRIMYRSSQKYSQYSITIWSSTPCIQQKLYDSYNDEQETF